jgi:hypothetical protein
MARRERGVTRGAVYSWLGGAPRRQTTHSRVFSPGAPHMRVEAGIQMPGLEQVARDGS